MPVRLVILSVLSIFSGLFLASRFANKKRVGVRAALYWGGLSLSWLGLLRCWLTFFVPSTWSWWL